jgi:hypothetical protein
MRLSPWIRLPSYWIIEKGLKQFTWHHGGQGADNTAALMALTAIAHVADEESGIAHVTYNRLCEVTGLSRAKLSNGLGILKIAKLIEPGPDEARSTYKLCQYDPLKGWAKFPAKHMYSGGRIVAFDEFRLRKMTELHALKLFFLFAAFRDQSTNFAVIGYPRIEEYTGISHSRIKSAISFLASLSLVYVEHLPRRDGENGVINAYRLVGIESFRHMGTQARTAGAISLS